MTLDPLQRFQAEHRAALDALARLEGAARRADLDVIRDVHRFLVTAVREHNDNEEAALFPALAELAPSEPFVEDHRALRALEQRLGRLLEQGGPHQDVTDAALAIVDLLRSHIAREEQVLFPTAREVLGPEGLAAVARRLGG